jgi:exoribonuclease-2
VEKGTLVEFWHNGERHLAVADRPEGKKHWIAIDANGQSFTLHPRQISYEVTGETYKTSEIQKFQTEIQSYLDPDSLEVAWEIMTETGETADPAEMANLLFSDRRPALCYAAYYLLSEDKLYFKNKGDRYEPRSATQVAELKHQIAQQEQKQREQQEFLTRIQQRLAGELVEWQPSDRQRLEAFERCAMQPEFNARPVLETLAALGRPQTAEGSFNFLVDIGWWSPHENLFLRRSSIPVQFPHKVVEVAVALVDSPPVDRDVDRLDLTHLKVYTIDDESTQEIDDGLSVERLADGSYKLWIHIADPTRLLSPDDDLDLEARRRSTTLYLPTGMIPMFPPQLATGPMSLVQGQLCSALSFGVVLDAEGGVRDYSIHVSTIEPTYRLTYEDVDEMLSLGLQSEAELATIADLAKLRQQWRSAQGSINIHMPEASIEVKGDEITIKLLEDAQSRHLVAEMMILAGEVAARYGREHKIALPFRSQPQPELPPETELLQIPAGPPRACAMRRCMPKSEMGIKPARHAGLGLENYTQVTSPIRRYTDLLAHFQIKAHLRGQELPFSAQKLEEIVQSVSSAAAEATLVERQTNRYWGLEYLRRHSEQVWQALMLRWLREDEALALILLEELGLELAMRCQRAIFPGDRLEVRVSHSDPRQDVIHLREMAASQPQAAAS